MYSLSICINVYCVCVYVCVFIVLTGLANRLLLVFGAACFNLCSVCRYCRVLLVPAFFPSFFSTF